MDKRQRNRIISHIVDLMKEGYTFSDISERVVKAFSLDNDTAYELVKTSFAAVSFLDRREPPGEKRLLLLLFAALLVSLCCAAIYSCVILYVRSNLVFMPLLLGYIIGRFLLWLSGGKMDTTVKFISGVSTFICYLISEYVVFLLLLKKEIDLRGILSEDWLLFIPRSIISFFIDYLPAKPFYEYLILFLAILVSISYFSGVRIRRIRR